MGELAALVKKHPEFIGIAVIVVIVLAWLQSRSTNSGTVSTDNGGGGDVTFTGGGVASAPIDPNVAAIQEAEISAKSANLTTLSQLVLGLNQAQFSRDVQERQTSAALSASLAQTNAALSSSLAQTEAQRHAVDVASTTDIATARIGADEQFNALNVTSQMAANASNAQLQAIQLDNQRQSEINATQRDIARVQAKQSFWGNIFGGFTDLAATLLSGF